MRRGLLNAMCLLVIGVYAYAAEPGKMESLDPIAADDYYNLLVQGFRAGQLNLKREVPPGLTQLTDPYDPAANTLYRSGVCGIHDLSYYKGRLYLYFGVTPALILFWPYVALSGHYLSHSHAATIFSALGFLISVGLLRALWRRYFAEVNVGVVAACTLALGLATGTPVLLTRSSVYEVAISCGYMLTMLALAAIWRALHEPERRCRWLATASVAYGLAVGARPSLLFGAVILLVPIAQAWRERHRVWMTLLAATGPILLIGLGLMLYNVWRFDNPFELGMRYQLAASRAVADQLFNPRYLWFNFRVYFLEPACWDVHFPFVHGIAVPPPPLGHDQAEGAFGILTNTPLIWLALAAPLAWRNRSGQTALILRSFVTAVALVFGTCALGLCLYWGAVGRYEMDFLPALLLLAAVGILGVERALADELVWQRAARWGWGLLLGFSMTFNLLASVEHCAKTHNDAGIAFAQVGRAQEAIEQFKQALRIKPDYVEARYNLGNVLGQTGQPQEAISQYERALLIKPDNIEAHCNLAIALAQLGRMQEAMVHWEQALRIKPDSAEVHYDIGLALEQAGKIDEAIGHYEQALRIKPDYAEVRNSLARLRAAR